MPIPTNVRPGILPPQPDLLTELQPALRQASLDLARHWMGSNDANDVDDIVQTANHLILTSPPLKHPATEKERRFLARRFVMKSVNKVAIRRRRRALPLHHANNAIVPQADPSTHLQTIDEITSLLDGLGQSLRRPLEMRYQQGLEITEIGRALQMSKNAVLTRLCRGRAEIRRRIARHIR